MKKLINKLFEWLGYVPKEENKWFVNHFNKRLEMDIYIQEEKARYFISEAKNYFLVIACAGTGNRRIIKSFSKGDTQDNQSYARICAEELCEMLNQKM